MLKKIKMYKYTERVVKEMWLTSNILRYAAVKKNKKGGWGEEKHFRYWNGLVFKKDC